MDHKEHMSDSKIFIIVDAFESVVCKWRPFYLNLGVLRKESYWGVFLTIL